MHNSSECESGRHVGVDEAVVTVSSALTVKVWSQSNECSQVLVSLYDTIRYDTLYLRVLRR